MFDFTTLQNNTENPTIQGVLFTVLCAFLLSSMLAFTYSRTSRTVSRPDHFIQAMMLISVVAATVMLAIGDSLARGLGMLGALAIIRFRTTLRDPRNMAFMFAALATGIASGVLGFMIAIVGTTTFCLMAVILRFSPFSRLTNLVGTLRFERDPKHENQEPIELTLSKHCVRYAIKSYNISGAKKAKTVEYTYQIKLKDEEDGVRLVDVMTQMPHITRIRLSFNEVGDIV